MGEMTMPNERLHPRLYAAYQWWYELSELKKRHDLRISAIERGVSNMDADFERHMLNGLLTRSRPNKRDKSKTVEYSFVDEAEIILKKEASQVPCWQWVTSIKGLGNGCQVAKVLALIDNIQKFPTVSKLWRYSGYGVYQYWVNNKGKVIAPKDGYQDNGDEIVHAFNDPVAMREKGFKLVWIADRKVKNWISPFNTTLKSSIYIVVDMFIKHRTDVYRDYYDMQKMEYRIKYPEKITVNGKTKYSDGHINSMAIRKVAKLWLQHLWVVWYTELGLPVTKPWVFEHGGHTDYIEPPLYDLTKIKYE